MKVHYIYKKQWYNVMRQNVEWCLYIDATNGRTYLAGLIKVTDFATVFHKKSYISNDHMTLPGDPLVTWSYKGHKLSLTCLWQFVMSHFAFSGCILRWLSYFSISFLYMY